MGRRFVFVSVLPCRALDELADQARRSDNLQVFVDGLTKKQVPDFNYLAGEWGSPQQTFDVLQHARRPMARRAPHQATPTPRCPSCSSPGPRGRPPLSSSGTWPGTTWARHSTPPASRPCCRTTTSAGPEFASFEPKDAVARTFIVWSENVASGLLEPEITRSEASELAGRLRAGSKTVLVTRVPPATARAPSFTRPSGS